MIDRDNTPKQHGGEGLKPSITCINDSIQNISDISSKFRFSYPISNNKLEPLRSLGNLTTSTLNLAGPSLYPTIASTLNHFCLHTVALLADLSKMFREIGLQEQDRAPSFLARRQVCDYRMKWVTFGVTLSPFLATRTLQRIAENCAETHQDASKTVFRQFYVDDCLTSVKTIHKKKPSPSDRNLMTIWNDLKKVEVKLTGCSGHNSQSPA